MRLPSSQAVHAPPVRPESVRACLSTCGGLCPLDNRVRCRWTPGPLVSRTLLVQGANILLDVSGVWHLGDMGSAVGFKEHVLSTSLEFCEGYWLGKEALPQYDWFMLLVLGAVELCKMAGTDYKEELLAVPTDGARHHASRARVQALVDKVDSPRLRAVFQDITSHERNAVELERLVAERECRVAERGSPR